MVIKTATYSGMNLKGEIRESISLDEDDISDVEDEVFIRDGKNGYKLAEDLNVKRPLMAPRRKHGKHDSGRLRPKPSCRAWCKPCCYILASLSVLIGLIVLVVVLLTIYPLPLDKLRDWILSKTKTPQNPYGHLPCTNLEVTDVWALNLPALTTDSPVRTLDIDGDGIEDILFGFGTGDNYNVFPPDIFCPIFLGVPPPCDGGIIALNGKNGNILWRHWLNDTIFGLHCTADINGDGTSDCLAVGVDGTIAIINSKTGEDIWKLNTGKMNVFVANFIPDQNGDNISDVLTSHSSLGVKTMGHIILLSGKSGQELKRLQTPNGLKTFLMPQLLKQNDSSTLLLFGTGSPNTLGNLSVISLSDLDNLASNSKTLYEDKFKGMLTQPVLVDITGDKVPDIISSVYNSTIVAINGKTLEKMWNYTIPNGVTDMSPTPAFFNCDNVTDFLVMYQKYDNIFKYNYTQTLIIDGFTGQPVYKPISGGVITQMSGLTLSMEGKGHDIYLFWSSECSSIDTQTNADTSKKPEDYLKVYDECKKQFNSTTILQLNALNEYHQPPGITIYNSAFRKSFEYNNTQSVMKTIREYLKNHPSTNPNNNYEAPILHDRGQSEIPKGYSGDPVQIGIRKYGKSNFRHKDRPSGIVKDFNVAPENANINALNMGGPQIPIPEETNNPEQPGVDYNIWMPSQEDLDQEFSNYNLGDDNIPYNQKQLLFDAVAPKMAPSNRDPRSKEKAMTTTTVKDSSDKDEPKSAKSKKKNLLDKIYGYRNVRLAKNRLLRDEESLPTDILKDTYFTNEESRLRKTKFEQRDVNSHLVGEMDDTDIKNIIEEQKKDAMLNRSTTLWDIETESEVGEREERGFLRRKRDVNVPNMAWESVSRVTSVGAVLSSFGASNTSETIDVVFVKYWQPLEVSLQTLMERDIEECISDKIIYASTDQKTTETEQRTQRSLFQKQCEDEQDTLRRDFAFFNQLAQLRLGQMTVYRIRIKCDCDSNYNKEIKERCVHFLPMNSQGWPEYLGRKGDGIFTS